MLFQTKSLHPRHVSWVLLAITSLIWGSSFILIKKALLALSPLEVGSLRICYAFLAFLPVVVLRAREIPRDKMAWLLVSGLMGSLFPSLLFSWAGSKIDSSLSGMLNAVTPLFTILISTVFWGERYARMKWLGLMIGLAGAGILSISKGETQWEWNVYALPVILATLFYAVNVNLIRNKLSGIPPLLLSATTIVAIGPFAMGILLGGTPFISHLQHQEGALRSAGFVAILGLMGTALALVLFNRLIQLSGTLVASSVTYLMPVVSVLWGLADGETIGTAQIAGLFAILGGVLLVNKNPDKASPERG